MKLYHGSSVVVRKPLIARGRKTTDFGKGFYTTTDFEQAARWARIKRERLGHGKAVVSVYDFDERFLEADEFQVLRYQGATEKWLDFVVQNRKGVLEHHYDLVWDLLPMIDCTQRLPCMKRVIYRWKPLLCN